MKYVQRKRPAFFFYTIALKKQLLNKRASIGITAANLFNQCVNQRIISYGSNFSQSNMRNIPLRSFGIILSFKFGKLQLKKEDSNIPQIPAID
ncbi:hypothetical protein DCC81_04010 [Chitinophaga parva]|uniref:Outer membrane protein beta-barrel domain-containing protein n=1 Tax=Chitinophaga parva TaxID=2169414 RepID=A0A2T7BLU8_9BACT|nr:hypothetical protein DCC81_04010 [Chitinophaga parva]